MSSADSTVSGTAPTPTVSSGAQDVHQQRFDHLKNLPQQLTSLDQWVAVSLEQNDPQSKPKKLPKYVNAGNLQNASVSNPSTWMRFEMASRVMASRNCDGVGFVLKQEDGLVIMDLDQCRDPETGLLVEWAQEIIGKFPTYTEISQSGTGLHLVFWGEKPPAGIRSGHVEVYSDKRFIWMTGHVLPGHERTVRDCKAALNELLEVLRPEIAGSSLAAERPVPVCRYSDDEVLKRIQKAKNGKKMLELYREGTWANNGYRSQSEADLALCGALYFWAEGDLNAVDRIFRTSQLMRPKWDEKRGEATYGQGVLKELVGGDIYVAALKEKSAITVLLELIAESGCEVFQSTTGDAYISTKVNDRLVTYPLESERARKVLNRLYYLQESKPIRSKDLQEVVYHLVARAEFNRVTRPVGLRVLRHDGCIYIALGNEEHQVVEVTAEGWSVKEAADVPVRFYQARGMQSLPMPAAAEKGDVRQLSKFIHVDETDLRSVVAFCISVLSGMHPYPILVIKGEHGTAKSTTTRMIRAVTDPARAGLRTLFRQEEDLYIYGQGSHLLAYDNVSFVTADQSDAFCRMATGSGFGRRKLYTNSDEQQFDMARPIILNGIPEVTDRADLADRALRIELKPMPEHERVDERTLWDGFNAVSGVILAGLLNALSASLKHWDTTVLSRKPRLMDFARLVTAAEQALPWKPGAFLDAYMEQRHDLILSTIDDDAFAQEIIKFVFMHKEAGVMLTATEFRTSIVTRCHPVPPKIPMNGRGFSQYLNRHKPAFRAAGVEFTQCIVGTGSDRRKIVARWIGDPNAVISSRPSFFDQPKLFDTSTGHSEVTN